MTGSAPASSGPLRAFVRPALCAAMALAVAALPDLGLPGGVAAEWACFVCAAALVAVAIRSHPDGLACGAAALFVAIAAKDGVLVVESAYVNLFHVVLGGIALALVWGWSRGRMRRLEQPLQPAPATGGPAAPATGAPAAPRLTRPRGMEWGLIAFPLAGLWSLIASTAPAATLAHVARLALLVTVALLVARLLPDERSRRVALTAFVFAAVPLAAVALFQWLLPELSPGNVHYPWVPPGADVEVRPAGFYMDPNFLGAHLVVAALIALGFAGSARRWYLWAITAAGLLGVVAITFSRSAWIAAAVGVVVLVFVGGRRVRRLSIAAVLATIILGAALMGPQSLLARAESMLDTGPESSNITRILMMRSALAIVADYPVFGVGLGAFERVYPSYVLEGADTTITHPHQVALAMAAEAGIGGVAAVLVLLVTGGVAMVRVCRGRPSHERAIVAVLLALGVASFFQYFLFFEVAWLFAGLLSSAAAETAAATEPRPSGKE